ncbi:ABC transporter permease [Agromyces atrinae]|uniref:ABC transporter permease n=1 Tax=Agromyces atrinae TaxID=592376 RepID=A0A4Q2M6N8_9MICO|nr:ABC transporter permease [Agromyces atrinae]NYD67199.1 ABC-type antimicrobial peptide transport system permease subunit [Agromyces atrinae]RXZ86967.1 ABC transporter permease [Agromyces atrinae]
MFFTYLRRELSGRRRQTTIIAIGLALAIALVMIVNSIAAGVRDAQASVLESLYGVGTDITVAATPTPPTEGEAPGGGRFEFEAGEGETTDGTTAISQSRLTAGFGQSTFDASALDSILALDGVSDASATLELTNMTFSGELPQRSADTGTDAGATDERGAPPVGGGPDGAGGSAFDVDSFSVLGLDPASSALGPLSSATISDGRALDASDAGERVALVDSTYATASELAVGDTIDVGGETITIVGVVTSNAADAASAADVYLPLDVAQDISGEAGMISSISVQATSSTEIDTVRAEIEAALPDTTVSTQDELASSVSGSLGTASSLVSTLGLWLSIAVLAAAFLIAILFTVQGVTRRTREFGTLEAIGWSDRRIVGQVTGESLVQGLIGGAAGLVVGLVGIGVINLVQPVLGGTSAATTALGAGPGGAGGPGGGMTMGGPGAAATQASVDVVLSAPVTVGVIAVAIGLAVLGGLVAGAVGGWRAARLQPAEALRSNA